MLVIEHNLVEPGWLMTSACNIWVVKTVTRINPSTRYTGCCGEPNNVVINEFASSSGWKDRSTIEGEDGFSGTSATSGVSLSGRTAFSACAALFFSRSVGGPTGLLVLFSGELKLDCGLLKHHSCSILLFVPHGSLSAKSRLVGSPF